jgi:hypothetical protein
MVSVITSTLMSLCENNPAAGDWEGVGMTSEQREFVLNLGDQCKTHDAWLALIRFGMGTLLSDQDVLTEILVDEAEREAERHTHGEAKHIASDHLFSIMSELGLRFATAAE